VSHRATVAVGAAVAFVVAFLLSYAGQAENRRMERIENAETKYGLTYLDKASDGEGGGYWRTRGDKTISCRISGDTDDPVLTCGADGTEPTRSVTS
jgi:hypothetical protein